MGVSGSSSILSSDEVDLKIGPIKESVLGNVDIKSFDQLVLDPKFKEFLYNNLDSDYLNKTLLSLKNGDSDLLKDFNLFKNQSEEDNQRLRENISNLESSKLAGIKIKSRELFNLIEEQIQNGNKIYCLPFLLSFQRRLAVFDGFQAFYEEERSLYYTHQQKRDWAESNLTSSKHPELKPIISMNKLALDILAMFPILLSSIPSESEKLFSISQSFFTTIQNLSPNELFSSWSPKIRPTYKLIPSSEGKELINKEKDSSSSNPVTNVYYHIDYSSPKNISLMRVSWIKNDNVKCDSTDLQLPTKITIIAKIMKGDSFVYEDVGSYSPNEEKKLQGTWIQYYPINRSNVISLTFTCSKKKFHINNEDFDENINFSKVEIFEKDSNNTTVNILSIGHQVISSLLPLLENSQIQIEAFKTIISLISSTSSLKLLLFTLWKIKELNFTLDQSEVKLSYRKIYDLVTKQNIEMIKAFNQKFGDQTKDIFDSISNDTLKGSKYTMDNRIITCDENGGSFVPNFEMNQGNYEWSFELIDLQGVNLGVISSATSAINQSLDELEFCAVDIEKGLLRNSMTTLKDSLYNFQKGDILKFSFDGSSKLLNFFINEVDYGVIFENIPSCYMFTFFNKGKSSRSVKLMSFQHIKKNNFRTNQSLSQDVIQYSNEQFFENMGKYIIQATTELSMNSYQYYRNLKRVLPTELPFCLDVSLGTFELFFTLLQHETDNEILISYLKLFEHQIKFLKDSQVPLKEIEYSIEELLEKNLVSNWEVQLETFTEKFKLQLKGLVEQNPCNNQILEVIENILAYGFEFFFPNIDQKIEYLNSIFVKIDKLEEMNQNRFNCLCLIFEQITTITFIQDFIQSDIDLLKNFYSKLIPILCRFSFEYFTQSNNYLNCSNFLPYIEKFLLKYYEELFSIILIDNIKLKGKDQYLDLLIHNIKVIFEYSKQLLLDASDYYIDKYSSDHHNLSILNDKLHNSFVSKLFQPLLCMCCSKKLPLHTFEAIGPLLTDFIGHLNKITSEWKISLDAMYSLSLTLSENSPLTNIQSGTGGWRTIKSVIEEGDNTFTVTDQGLTYTSVQSNNTCAYVNVKFTPFQKGAWEFVLETDSNGDECSVFGAVRLPLSSRCYSSSPELWMRRSYNGYMYANGSTTSLTLSKIHPGDTVRIEYDGPSGTLSYSVNGGDLEVGFTGIIDDIYPACGSYRNGVVIKLVKVEVFDKNISMDESEVFPEFKPTEDISFIVPEEISRTKLSTYIQCKLEKPSNKKKKIIPSKWLTARGNRGAYYGIHDWSFEFNEFIDGKYALGVAVGEINDLSQPLAKDLSNPNHLLVTPLDSILESIGKQFAWYSDGSLWCDQKKVCNSYGASFLPLKPYSIITIRVDFHLKTITYFVNGENVGIAFGPSEFQPKVPMILFSSSSNINDCLVFPSASLLSYKTTIKLVSSGFHGSSVIPLLDNIKYSGSSVISRIVLSLIQGPALEKEENSLLCWLQSPLFLGGLDLKYIFKYGFQFDSVITRELTSNEVEVETTDDLFLIQMSSGSNTLMDYQDSIVQLYEWFETLDSEPVSLRKVLEKNNSFRFPQCELPLLACLIKHTGLVNEINSISQAILMHQTFEPSEDIFFLWQKVKQLRTFLRRQRQSMKTQLVFSSMADETSKELENLTISDSNAPIVSDNIPEVENVKAENSLLSSIEPELLNGLISLDNVVWAEMIADTQARQSEYESVKIEVYKYGFDILNQSLFVLLIVDRSSGDKNSPSPLLKFDEVSVEALMIKFTESLKITDSKYELELIWFDLSLHEMSLENFQTKTFEFNYNSKFPKILLCSDASKISLIEENKPQENDQLIEFTNLCQKITKKAQFLLSMKSAAIINDTSTRGALIGLTSIYSGNSTVIRNKQELSKWKTQDRWRRVIEFLHIQTKVRRQNSLRSQGSEQHPNLERGLSGSMNLNSETNQLFTNLSSSLPTDNNDASSNIFTDFKDEKTSISIEQATIQACAVFVYSEELTWSIDSLLEIMQLRLKRAHSRIEGFKLLGNILHDSTFQMDPYHIFEILTIIKNGIPPNDTFNSSDLQNKSNIQFSESNSRKHYLANIEGCSPIILKKVQNEISSLFHNLGDILALQLNKWEKALHTKEPSNMRYFYPPSTVKNIENMFDPKLYFHSMFLILKMFVMQFSNRDFHWILQSQILPSLYKLISFNFQETIINSWSNSALLLFEYAKLFSCDEISNKFTLLTEDIVSDGLSTNKISSRSLLMNVLTFSFGNFTKENLKSLGILNDDYSDKSSDFFQTLTSSQIYELFLNVSKFHGNIKIKFDEDIRKKEEEKAAEQAEKENEDVKRLGPSGLFDSNKCASDIRLSETNTQATFRGDGSHNPSAVYTTIKYLMNQSVGDSGNYFEVTVFEVGDGDVGIGLADATHFPLKGQMPGWQEHSYGYHGDDGKKFGSYSTEGTWPLFEPNDVIGCGFDPTTRSIFYTRNGELLGTAFENVPENELYPVLAVSNQHSATIKVKINFGVEPFMYTGPEIIVNSLALLERLARSDKEELNVSTDTIIKVDVKVTENQVSAKDIVKTILQLDMYRSHFQEAENLHQNYCRLNELSQNILNYLFLLSTMADNEIDSSEPNSNPSSNEIVNKLILIRDHSRFGTPKANTSSDSIQLQRNILSAFTHEIIIGSQYRFQLTKSISTTEVTDLSFSTHCSVSLLEEQLFNETKENNSKHNYSKLEIRELDMNVNRYLNTIVIFIDENKYLQNELSNRKILRILFELLDHSSYVIEEKVLSILRKLLITIEPERIEESLPLKWLEKVKSLDGIFSKIISQSRLRKHPDSFIRYLLLDASKVFSYDSLSSQSHNYFGAGGATIKSSISKIYLLQTMFENPLWTEFIAININNILRYTEKYLEKINITNESGLSLHERNELISLACSVVNCIQCIPVPIPGCLGKIESGSKALILSTTSLPSSKLKIILESNMNDFSCTRHVEVIEKSSFSMKPHVANIDLTKISQPILSQLVTLTKVLLPFSCNKKLDKTEFIAVKKLCIRLCGFIFPIFSNMLVKQNDIVLDFLLDPNTLECFAHQACIPLEIPSSSTYRQLLDTWIFFQSRTLEGFISSKNLENNQTLIPDNIEIKNEILPTLIVPSDQPIPLTELGSPISIDPSVRSDRLAFAQTLADEFKFDPLTCLNIYEYCMLDEIKTRAILTSLVTKEKTLDPEKSAIISNLSEYSKLDCDTCYNVLNYCSFDESEARVILNNWLKKEKAPTDDNSLQDQSDNTISDDNIKDLENLSLDSSGSNVISDKAFESFVVSENEKDLVLLIDNVDEKNYGFSLDEISILSRKDNDGNLIIQYYSEDLHKLKYKLIKASEAKRINLIYSQDQDKWPEVVDNVDVAFLVLSIRNILNGLMVHGNVKMTQFSNFNVNPIVLLKLICSSSSQNFKECLRNLLNSFTFSSPSTPFGEFDEKSELFPIAKDLIQEISSSMDTICNPIFSHKNSNISTESDQEYHISSPHPYVSPMSFYGYINIPKTWIGASINFNSKSATTGEKAKLKFYRNYEDMKNHNHFKQFFGYSKTSPSFFSNFSISEISRLYFSFEADSYSEFEPLETHTLQGLVEKSDEGIWNYVEAMSHVGLGDEDNLFNLFTANESTGVLQPSTIISQNWVTSGNWCFEVYLKSFIQDSDFLYIGLLENEELSDENPHGLGEGFFAINQLNQIVCKNNYINSSNTSNIWCENSTISFLFKIEDSSFQFRYAVNGEFYSEIITCPFTKKLTPAISFLGKSVSFILNFGETSLCYPHLIAFADDTLSTPVGHSKKSLEHCWGYDFKILPVSELHVKATRNLELVWSPKPEDNDGFYIWRAKAKGDFIPTSDIITSTSTPPPRALLIDKNFCKPAEKVEIVFNHNKKGLIIARPIPPVDYISLGDSFSSESSVAPSKFYCIPSWAVKPLKVNRRFAYLSKTEDKKLISQYSLWTGKDSLGFFYGSSTSEQPSLDSGYTFSNNYSSILFGEWMNEEDILTKPSLKWNKILIESIIQIPKIRPLLFSEKNFLSFINYLRSSSAVSPLSIVPTLVQFIRQAHRSKFSFLTKIEEAKVLCSCILNQAYNSSQSGKKELTTAMMSLVDLAIEMVSVSILENCKKVSKKELQREKLKFEESKEEDISNFIEEKDMEIEDIKHADINPELWWRRQIDQRKVDSHRLFNKNDLSNVFCKETIYNRLTQTLKFFYTIGDPMKINEEDDEYYASSYSKVVTSKVWYDNLSTCAYLESHHPYFEHNFQRTVNFPGAQHLYVTFDKRFSLSEGDKLTIKSKGQEFSFIGPLTDSNINTAGPQFVSDELTVIFESKDPTSLNPTHEWGWAILIAASGPVFESVELSIDLNEILDSRDFGHTVLNTKTHFQEETRANLISIEEVSEWQDIDVGVDSSDNAINDTAITSKDISKRRLIDQEIENLKIETKNDSNSFQDPLIECALSMGRLVKSGELCVPHSSSLEVKVERPGLSSEGLNFRSENSTFVLQLTPNDKLSKKSDAQVFVLSSKLSKKLFFSGNSLLYEIWAIDNKLLKELINETVETDSIVELDIVEEKVLLVPELSESLPEPVLADGWSCPFCTFFNPSNAATCDVCLNRRPCVEGSESEIPAEAAPLAVGWWCTQCTLINTLTNTVCDACGAARPSDEPETKSTEESPKPSPSSPSDSSDSKSPVEIESKEKAEKDIIHILAKGKLDPEAKFESRLEAAVINNEIMITPFQVYQRSLQWTREEDSALMEYLNTKSNRKSELNAFPNTFTISKDYLAYQGNLLAKHSMIDIIIRTQYFEILNKNLELLYPLVDLGNTDPHSFGAILRRSSKYIMMKIKTPLLEKSIQATMASGSGFPASIILDNAKALHSKEKGDKEIHTSQNCFVQAFRQLHTKDPKLFCHIISNDRVFQINFADESGIDAGGVFREGVSRIIEDLYSDSFNLLLLCPNGQQAVHSGMDKYLPNPKQTGPLALQMFEFLGKLMSMSIRAKLCLPFEFPQLVWKKLSGEECSKRDLLEVDMITARQLEDIENCHSDASDPVTNQGQFEERFQHKLKFTYISSDNTEKELFPGGSSVEVTFENRLEYVEKFRQARLKEFDIQIESILRGMSVVIPSRALMLFSSFQLEELVCGSAKVDIALWKENTEVSGVSTRTVTLFWKVMESLSPKDQTGFIRFAWGRSRLPLRSEDFSNKFRLTSGGRAALPVSHTCFFSVELPEYHTEEEMRHGLLTAIHYGVGGILLS